MSEEDVSILRMLAGRMTENEIAFALDVSPDSVAGQVKAILEELGVDTREEAVAIAVERGIIDNE